MRLVRVVVTIAVAALVGCGREQAQVSPKPTAPREFVFFRPLPDPVATELWSRIGTIGVREQLAAHYEQTGYRAMAAFVRAGEAGPLLQMRKDHWACPDLPNDAVEAAVGRVNEGITKNDHAAAIQDGEQAIEKIGPACPLLLQVAVAKLGFVLYGGSLAPAELEVAMRTFVTADVEMGFPNYTGAREWPYQLLTGVFLRRKDARSAVMASEVAIARLEERRAAGEIVTPVMTEMLQKLHARAVAALRAQ